MDPFMEIYQESLRHGKTAEEALSEVRQIAGSPANRAMLADLDSSNTGQLLLSDWQREWSQWGLCAPWRKLISKLRPRL